MTPESGYAVCAGSHLLSLHVQYFAMRAALGVQRQDRHRGAAGGAAPRACALAKEQSVAAQHGAHVSAVAHTARCLISVLPAHGLSLPEADP